MVITNEIKAQEIRAYITQQKMPNGIEDGLNMMSDRNKRYADLDNIYAMCEAAAMEMAKWKEKEFHIKYNNLRSRYREYITKDRQDTLDFVVEWLTDGTDLPEGIIEDLADDLRKANEEKDKIERRNK